MGGTNVLALDEILSVPQGRKSGEAETVHLASVGVSLAHDFDGVDPGAVFRTEESHELRSLSGETPRHTQREAPLTSFSESSSSRPTKMTSLAGSDGALLRRSPPS